MLVVGGRGAVLPGLGHVVVRGPQIRKPKAAYVLAIIGFALSIGDRLWIVLHDPVWNRAVAGRVYYAFDTRADALFVGCLLGLVATGGHLDGWKPWAKRTLTGLALVSAGVMIWIIVNVGVGSRALPLWLLPVTEGASAIIITYFLLQPRASTRALGIPVLVLLGNMSYAIYLLHWPVFVAISPFTVRWPFWVYETVRLVVILLVALASWYLVERPLMLWRRKALDPVRLAVAVSVPPDSPSPPGDRDGSDASANRGSRPAASREAAISTATGSTV